MNTYDFDKTIFYPDSSVTFIKHCFRKYPWIMLKNFPGVIPQAIAYAVNGGSAAKLKEKLFAFLKDIPDIDSEVERFWAEHKELIRPVRCAADIKENMDAGRISAMLTLEDGVCIDGRMERVQQLYDRGVRMIALTWNYENSIGFPNSVDPKLHALGLKPFGFEVVERMGELGMIVDVSHLSEGGFFDVAEAVKGPFAASHSCARALCGHSRNLTDRQLRVLGDHGGVCGVNFYSSFLTGTDFTAIDDILRHMEYIADKAGIEAVALGSDFDGIDYGLEFGGYAGMTRLVEAIAARFGSGNADRICYENALRVMRDVIG